MKSFNSTIELLKITCILGLVMKLLQCSILNDIHIFTGELFGDSFINDRNSPFLHAKKDSQSICMDQLGCFSIDDDDFFHPVHRPVNILPDHRDKINTKYLLFTRLNMYQPFLLSTKNSFSLTKSTFDARRKTKFIIHGLFDSIHYIDWMIQMKDEFLKRGDFNVIVVDWSQGNQIPYTQATANTRVVGTEIALLIRMLELRMGITQESVHLIGHSLGSHISGYAGERLQRLGRITALDPANPYFKQMPPKVRLDTSDALFVDAWHTNAGTMLNLSLGMTDAIAHVDFFPNNGRDQPGCKDPKKSIVPAGLNIIEHLIRTFSLQNIISVIRGIVVCDHDRAVKFFMESINSKPGQCRHVGYVCSDYQTFLAGKCADCGEDGKNCAVMGYDMEDTKDRLSYDYVEGNQTDNKKYYLATSGEEPFCLFHYQILISITGDRTEEGYINMEVATSSGETYRYPLSREAETFQTGSIQTYLITSPVRLNPGEVTGISLIWRTTSPSWSSLERRIYIKYLSIVPMEYTTRNAQKSNTIVFKSNSAIGHSPGRGFTLKASKASVLNREMY